MSYIADEHKLARKRRNAQNKSRAKAMEQRIARELDGHRVPMSGAGSLKGDGIVYSSKGLYLFECKCSAAHDITGTPTFQFNMSWMPKLDQDCKSMRAVFGVLIFHFHMVHGDFAVLKRDVFEKFSPRPLDEKEDVLRSGLVYRVVRRTFRFKIDQLRRTLITNGARFYEPIALIPAGTLYGDFVIMPLEYFKELLLDERPVQHYISRSPVVV